MISTFELPFDITEEMLGIVAEKKDPAPKEGETLQLYIPVLMTYISKSIPSAQRKFINKGSKLFLNSTECRPVSKNILLTQNYLTGTLEKNSEWIHSTNTSTDSRELENSDGYKVEINGTDAEGRPIQIELHEQYKKYYTIGGERVNCYAPNGRLSKLLFDNDVYV